ncbi:MAG: NIPSNAP family protein [Acidimicrobiia bacterium]
MIFELRQYESTPARIGELHARFRDHTLSLFREHGITPVAFWTEADRPYVVVYLVCFNDESARERAWGSLREDPAWRNLLESTDPDGDLIVDRTRKLLVETDYSPSALRWGG